jgi:radical SAM-linked protein
VRTLGSRTPDGPAPPPAVQRLRIRYAKRGRLRFTSHRDIQRAFERALRRAAVPMAYSAGFSPHPKISWAGAAPTGTASEAEYVEIAVTARQDPDLLKQALDAALPPDLDILEIVEARSGSLAERLEASVWSIELPGVGEAELLRARDAFMGADLVMVERLTKTGMRTFDARAAVLALEVARSGGGYAPRPDSAACAILQVVVRHTTPAVRPDDVLTGLGKIAGLSAPSTPRVTRLAQGPLPAAATPEDSGPLTGAGTWLVADPMTLDRSVSPNSEPLSVSTPGSGV